MSIKVIESPSVYLVGRQQVGVPELDRFLSDEGVAGFRSDATKAGEELVEVAGRLCYMSFAKPRPGGNAKYIEHILEVGHGSVCEHAVFNFIVTGVSRSLTHELVRHRVGFAYSQLSQRYVDESDVAFVVPPALMGIVKAARDYLDRREETFLDPSDENESVDVSPGVAWLDACGYALSAYRHIVEEHMGDPAAMNTARKKEVREAARSVLPNCTETKIFVTANVRALRHFVEMRGDAGADAEIRRLAHAFLAVLREESPNLFSDYAIDRVAGVDVVCTPYMKV